MLSYLRLECLERILPLLVDQAAPLDARVLVVDNDPEGGARPVAASWSDRGVEYVHEPRPGISVARNRALDEASSADALVFIDDDETPEPAWLDSLVRVWQRYGCAAVTGPVDAVFAADVDPWVVASGVLAQPDRQTGTVMASAASNNLLLDVVQISRSGIRFDDRFGLTGGEDTVFCRSLTRWGGEIRWCGEAVVVDAVPSTRATRRWMLRRTFRAGTTWSRMTVMLESGAVPKSVRRSELVARALGRALTGSARVIRGAATRDLTTRATGTVAVVSAAGMVAGAFGFAPKEYGRSAFTAPVSSSRASARRESSD